MAVMPEVRFQVSVDGRPNVTVTADTPEEAAERAVASLFSSSEELAQLAGVGSVGSGPGRALSVDEIAANKAQARHERKEAQRGAAAEAERLRMVLAEGTPVRVGDTVRIRDLPREQMFDFVTSMMETIGCAGRVVRECRESERTRVLVNFPNRNSFWYWADTVERVESRADRREACAADPDRGFAVGARVRVVRDAGREAYSPGRTGIVRRVNQVPDPVRRTYHVQLDGYSQWSDFYESDLAEVGAPVDQVCVAGRGDAAGTGARPAFRPGDQVRLVRMDRENTELYEPVLGKVGVVDHSVGDDKAFAVDFGDGNRRSPYVENLELVARAGEPGCVTPQGAVPQTVGRVERRDPPRETWSADLVLADGRAVTLPGPDPARWELVEEQRIDPCEATQFRASGTTSVVHGRNCTTLFVNHVEGRCWLGDMGRIVNERRTVSPWEERWTYATVLRRWRERAVVQERYTGSESLLACLW